MVLLRNIAACLYLIFIYEIANKKGCPLMLFCFYISICL